jgi:S1-C subfamily serine protease
MVFSDFLNYNLEQNSIQGVVVSELNPGGLAAISGLHPTDVIQRINDQSVGSVDEFENYLASIEEERPPEIVFFVWRYGQTMFVNLKTDWP